MATTSSGHERKDHDFDDGCWQEVEIGKGVVPCTCSGFQPITTINSETSVAAQEWDRLFREVLVEWNHSPVLEKIAAAERAIRCRMTEVRPSDGREWQRLRDALQTLKFIKAPL